MKKLIPGLLMLAFPSLLFAQMVVYTNDGRTFTVPVKAGEISRIEFTEPTPPVKTVSNPFIGKWARKDGGNIVEYMDVVPVSGQFDLQFRVKPDGPVVLKVTAQLQNGEMKGKGTSRLVSMRMNTQQQVEYKSTDFDGKNPWTCTWFRVN